MLAGDASDPEELSFRRWSDSESDGGSRAAFVYEAVRAAILRGDLRAGGRIRETQLAEQLGVSRTPVREALCQLEWNGLVRVLPQRGAIVNELDQRQVNELHDLREILDSAIARLATERATDAEVRAIADLVNLQEQARVQGRDSLDEEFHLALAAAARNQQLVLAWRNLSDKLALARSIGSIFSNSDQRDDAVRAHRDIVAAIESRDAAAAEAAARRHVQAIHHLRLMQMFQSQNGESGAISRQRRRASL